MAADGPWRREVRCEGDAVIVVERERERVTISLPGRWIQALTLEQAWQLAEALGRPRHGLVRARLSRSITALGAPLAIKIARNWTQNEYIIYAHKIHVANPS